jgi:hypothetical protein
LAVAPHRHNEPTYDGKPVYIIETPGNPNFAGKRMGVVFRNGQARTISERRARWFAERPTSVDTDKEIYRVLLPAGHPGLVLADARVVAHEDEDPAGYNEDMASKLPIEDELDDEDYEVMERVAAPAGRRRKASG